jgi:thioredoxin-like negative regulator of GroEL
MAIDVIELDEFTFEEVLATSGKLVIVELYLSTCPHCQAVAPVYEQLARELSGEAVFARLEALRNRSVEAMKGFRSVPAFRYFCEGMRVGENVGYSDAKDLEEGIRNMIRQHRDCAQKATPLGQEPDARA